MKCCSLINGLCIWPRPFLVNELEPQHLLHDRRKVYEVWSRNIHLILRISLFYFSQLLRRTYRLPWYNSLLRHTHMHARECMHNKQFSTHPLEECFPVIIFFPMRVLRQVHDHMIDQSSTERAESIIYFLKSAIPHRLSLLMTIIELCMCIVIS